MLKRKKNTTEWRMNISACNTYGIKVSQMYPYGYVLFFWPGWLWFAGIRNIRLNEQMRMVFFSVCVSVCSRSHSPGYSMQSVCHHLFYVAYRVKRATTTTTKAKWRTVTQQTQRTATKWNIWIILEFVCVRATDMLICVCCWLWRAKDASSIDTMIYPI